MFNHIIKLFICFQLIFYPVVSSAQNLPEEQYRQTQVDTAAAYNQKIDSLFENIFGPRSFTQAYTNHPLDFYSLVGQKVNIKDTVKKGSKKGKIIPFFKHINPNQLVVEVISIHESDEQKVEATLNNSRAAIKKKSIAEAVQPGEMYSVRSLEVQDLYKGAQYSIQNTELLHSFVLSYRGRVLHHFSNNIQG
ncbi:MAG: hypothetical protein OXM55_08615 [Bdellovibrionales bacterium]|nr:hypothetical protein [Bdellovibrionales bacterium]